MISGIIAGETIRGRSCVGLKISLVISINHGINPSEGVVRNIHGTHLRVANIV